MFSASVTVEVRAILPLRRRPPTSSEVVSSVSCYLIQIFQHALVVRSVVVGFGSRSVFAHHGEIGSHFVVHKKTTLGILLARLAAQSCRACIVVHECRCRSSPRRRRRSRMIEVQGAGRGRGRGQGQGVVFTTDQLENGVGRQEAMEAESSLLPRRSYNNPPVSAVPTSS